MYTSDFDHLDLITLNWTRTRSISSDVSDKSILVITWKTGRSQYNSIRPVTQIRASLGKKEVNMKIDVYNSKEILETEYVRKQ